MAKDAKGHGSEKRGGGSEKRGGVSDADVAQYNAIIQKNSERQAAQSPLARTNAPDGPAHQSGVAAVGSQVGQMKMSPENFASLSAAVKPHLASTADPTHSAMRQRCDAMNKSGFDTRPLYKAGLNDDHIDTALRKIQSSGGGGGG